MTPRRDLLGEPDEPTPADPLPDDPATIRRRLAAGQVRTSAEVDKPREPTAHKSTSFRLSPQAAETMKQGVGLLRAMRVTNATFTATETGVVHVALALFEKVAGKIPAAAIRRARTEAEAAEILFSFIARQDLK